MQAALQRLITAAKAVQQQVDNGEFFAIGEPALTHNCAALDELEAATLVAEIALTNPAYRGITHGHQTRR